MSASSPVKRHEVTLEISSILRRIPDGGPLAMEPGVKVLTLLKERDKGNFSRVLMEAEPANIPELVTGREVGKSGASWEKKLQEPNFFLTPETQ